jgi:hypothetical protein
VVELEDDEVVLATVDARVRFEMRPYEGASGGLAFGP